MPRQNHKRACICVYTGAIKKIPPPLPFHRIHLSLSRAQGYLQVVQFDVKKPEKWFVTDINFIIGAPLKHADGVRHAGTTYLRGNEYTLNTH